jgi:anti-sigma B factor antagonist
MDLSITTKGKAAVVALKGDLDYNSYKELEAAIETSLAQDSKLIVIDISEVPHVDSMGLGTLTRYWKIASQQNAALCIAGARKNVQSMINLVNLDKRIGMFEDVSSALA